MEVAVKPEVKRPRVMIVLDRKANRPDRNFIGEFYSAMRRFETGTPMVGMHSRVRRVAD